MRQTRRGLLAAAPALLAAPALAPALAQTTAPSEADPRLAERASGRAEAPATVIEYFSLTCGACAAFHRDTWPRVRSALVEPGRVRLVWRDFPLDQLALAAAVVARAAPPERYEGLVGALLATQDRWAFARGADHLGEIAKVAALAGMSREQVDAALADPALQRGVLEARLRGERDHRVNSTPTFVFGNRVVPGVLDFERFSELAGV